MTFPRRTKSVAAESDETFSRSCEAEFPGVPSTQEWHEDFPATQIPARKPRTAYITPQTSFNVPSDETESGAFGIERLAGAPQTPIRRVNESTRGMPPTPMSINKQDVGRAKDTETLDRPSGRANDVPRWRSTHGSEEASVSSILTSNTAARAKDTKGARRRRRRPKRQSHNMQTSQIRSETNTSNPTLAALRSSPEPWPLPFPLADKGIYPYLPPAMQFDQMVKFTSSTEEHIDKWNLHHGTYPVALLRQVLSAQECVHMGLYSQLEHMDKLLEGLEKMMKPIPAKERAKRGKVGDKYKRVSPQMLQGIKFMRSITRQQQVCYYESRIPTQPDFVNS